MARICEVCGRVEKPADEEQVYDILDVCSDCTEHVIHSTSEIE
ncbi:hypothetical protein [Virgibacillus sp. DJP39]